MSSGHIVKASAYLLSIAVLAALLFGQSAHALIPHEHGETGGEVAIWGSLHASLRHDEKHAVIPVSTIDESRQVPVVALSSVGSRTYARRAHSIRNPMRDALRRGTVAHRKFR